MSIWDDFVLSGIEIERLYLEHIPCGWEWAAPDGTGVTLSAIVRLVSDHVCGEEPK